MPTTSKQAQSLVFQFQAIRERGGHAAIDFRDGEIMLTCTKPSSDPATWGAGAVPQAYTGAWVRLVEC